jgi:hypothetical protein
MRIGSLDSAVGRVIGYWLVLVPLRSRIFYFLLRADLLWAYLASYTMRTGALSPEVKRPGRETTTHLQIVPRTRTRGSIYIYSSIRLHGAVLSKLNAETTYALY